MSLRRILFASVLVIGLSGCAMDRYDVTLTNGANIISRGHPKLVNGYYVFRDIEKKKQVVPEYRVSVIAPHSEKRSPFNNYGAQ